MRDRLALVLLRLQGMKPAICLLSVPLSELRLGAHIARHNLSISKLEILTSFTDTLDSSDREIAGRKRVDLTLHNPTQFG